MGPSCEDGVNDSASTSWVAVKFLDARQRKWNRRSFAAQQGDNISVVFDAVEQWLGEINLVFFKAGPTAVIDCVVSRDDAASLHKALLCHEIVPSIQLPEVLSWCFVYVLTCLPSQQFGFATWPLCIPRPRTAVELRHIVARWCSLSPEEASNVGAQCVFAASARNGELLIGQQVSDEEDLGGSNFAIVFGGVLLHDVVQLCVRLTDGRSVTTWGSIEKMVLGNSGLVRYNARDLETGLAIPDLLRQDIITLH
jgi:hypothetical protein